MPGWLVGPIALAFCPPRRRRRHDRCARRAAACASRSAGGGGASFRPKNIPAGSFGQFGTSL